MTSLKIVTEQMSVILTSAESRVIRMHLVMKSGGHALRFEMIFLPEGLVCMMSTWFREAQICFTVEDLNHFVQCFWLCGVTNLNFHIVDTFFTVTRTQMGLLRRPKQSSPL